MKKLHIRFIAYFTAGLFLFLIYFIVLFLLFTWLVYPQATAELSYVVDAPGGYFPIILIFAFCFLTGGTLFSLFLVRPLSLIIGTINGLSKEDYAATEKAFTKQGTLKWHNFLYREVIINIKALGNTLQETSLEQEKLEVAKTDWLAGVSHDLKTPLSYINGYSSLMLNESHSFSEEERQVFLSEIYQKGAYIEKLIDDLSLTFFIDAAGKMQLKYTQIEIVSFLQNLIADVANHPKAEKQIFEFHTEQEHLHVVVDEMLMYRAIFNLLMNSVDHNPDGTEINIVLEQSVKGICIAISDNGVGMDAEMANDIFDKYYSSRNGHTQGKGLGVFIAKQVIDAHGGNISVSSTVGKGTSFQIVLERHKE